MRKKILSVMLSITMMAGLVAIIMRRRRSPGPCHRSCIRDNGGRSRGRQRGGREQ